MANITKRIAAISLAASLGLAGAGTAAYAAPSETPAPQSSKAAKAATATPSAEATTTASAKATATTAAPSATATATESATKSTKKDVTFSGARVEWMRGASTGTVTGKLLDENGKGMSGVKLTAYDFSGSKVGKELGSGTTDANGNFKFSVKIIGGADGSVDMALIFPGNDKYNKRMVTTTVKAGDNNGSMDESKKPTAKPTATKTKTSSSKDKGDKEKQGGLASTGA